MYAYVSFTKSQDPNCIVDTTKIYHFNPENYDKQKKYNVLLEDGAFHEVVILKVAETEKELESSINVKRVRKPNSKFFKSASNLTKEELNETSERKRSLEKTTREAEKKTEEPPTKKISNIIKTNKQENAAKTKQEKNEREKIPSTKKSSQQSNKEVTPNSTQLKEILKELPTDSRQQKTILDGNKNCLNCQKLKEGAKILKKELSDAKEHLAVERKKNQALQKKTEDLSNTVLQLNETVISKMSMVTDIVQESVRGNSSRPHEASGNPSIGFLNKVTQTKHIGYGIEIPEGVFSTLMGYTHPVAFIKDSARAVFGVKTLSESTVTGKPSQRNLKNPNVSKPKKLDPRKMNAMTEFFKYFINSPKFDDMSNAEKSLYSQRIGYYTSELIADLKKKPKKKKEANSQALVSNLIEPIENMEKNEESTNNKSVTEDTSFDEEIITGSQTENNNSEVKEQEINKKDKSGDNKFEGDAQVRETVTESDKENEDQVSTDESEIEEKDKEENLTDVQTHTDDNDDADDNSVNSES